MINSEIFSDKVQATFKWINDLGYKYQRSDANIKYDLIKNNVTFSISFSWTEYDEIHVYGLGAFIRFDKIESIIENAVDGSRDSTIWCKWEGKIPNDLRAIKEENNPFNNTFFIANEFQVEFLSQIVQNFYHNEACDFFENFKSIPDVLEWLKNHDVNQHSNLIVQSKNAGMLRRLILLKEGRSKEFPELYARYRDFLQSKAEQKVSPYDGMFKIVKELDYYFSQSS